MAESTKSKALLPSPNSYFYKTDLTEMEKRNQWCGTQATDTQSESLKSVEGELTEPFDDINNVIPRFICNFMKFLKKAGIYKT